MSFTEGADVDVLAHSATSMRRCATVLESARRDVDRTAAELSVDWRGHDSATFRRQWSADCSPALHQAVKGLLHLVEVLATNVAEQRRASGEGDYHGEGPSADRVTDARNAQQAWEFAEDSYRDESSGLPAGWHRLDADELAKVGLTPADLKRSDGFQAAVYADASGHYVIGFAGTQDLTDWGTNLAQGVGFVPGPYQDCIEITSKLVSHVGADHVLVTGHSQGGGLAATAALALGVPAYTFNAAGVNDSIRERYAAVNPDGAAHANSLVHNYYVAGEPLSGAERLGIGPSAVGTQYEMPAVLDDAAQGRIRAAGLGGMAAGARLGTGLLPGVGTVLGGYAGYEVGVGTQKAIELHVQSGVQSSIDSYVRGLH